MSSDEYTISIGDSAIMVPVGIGTAACTAKPPAGSKTPAVDPFERAVHIRHPADKGWVVLQEVPDAPGAQASRRADFVAFGMWASRKYEVVGYEKKLTREDWRKERDNPEKAESIAKHCHRWYVIAPPGVVPPEEIPPGWGLVEVGDKIRTVVNTRAAERPNTVPRSWFMAVLYRAVDMGRLPRLIENAKREAEARALTRVEKRPAEQERREQELRADIHALVRERDALREATKALDAAAKAAGVPREEIEAVLAHRGAPEALRLLRSCGWGRGSLERRLMRQIVEGAESMLAPMNQLKEMLEVIECGEDARG